MPKRAKKEIAPPVAPTPPEPPKSGICAQSNCKFVHFWHRWGGHFDLSGGIACLSMLATIIYFGCGFVRDTQAYGPKIQFQEQSIELVKAELDRVDGNMQIMMNALNLTPLKKSDTEIQLEHQQRIGAEQ